uniref:Uncharacterized protein n=1 Tax=Ciona savignyi TaxID=51511 RepID=H2YTA1_CIOSA
SSKTPTNEEKPRKFGDVLPVPDEGKHHEESDFLTPPSDLASPSSSGFLTSSSSRSSSPSDSGLAAGGSGALQYEIETSLCRSATPSDDRIDTEDDVLRRKPHKDADDHRMSWAFEPIPDVPG